MSLVTVGAVVGIAGGINSIYQSNKGGAAQGANTGPQAAQAADPFAQYRGQFGAQFQGAYDNLNNWSPQNVQNDPAYQFQLQQGMGAVNKGDAASGMLNSGTRMYDLQKMGQGLASSFENTAYQRQLGMLGILGQASGATTGNFGAAANAYTQGGQNAYNNNQNNLSNLGYGLNKLGNWWNGPIGGGTNPGGNGTGPDWTGSGFPEGGG